MRDDSRSVNTYLPRMSDGDVEQLLLHLIRHPAVFAHGKDVIRREQFTKEPHFGLLWECFLEVVTSYGFSTAPEAALHSAFGRALNSTFAVTDEQADDILHARDGFIAHAFNKLGPTDLNEEFGLRLLKQFLRERDVADEMRRVVRGSEAGVPERMTDLIGQLQNRQARIDTLGRTVKHSVVLDEFADQHVEWFPTGCSFFDKHMAGGHGCGELNLLAAHYGTGKTTLLCQMAVNAAIHFHARARCGEPLRHVYLFSYEEVPKEIRRRIIAYAADISKTELDLRIKSQHDMSRRGRLKDYERKLFQRKGLANLAEAPGEYERYMALRDTIDRNLHIMDMTGMDNHEVGSGGVDEILAMLQNERTLGHTPGLVLIDFANLMVTRYSDARGLRSDAFRLTLLSQLAALRLKVLVPMNVPGWVAQQYAGASQQRRPTVLMQMADLAECKSAGQYTAFTMLFGSKDPESQVMQMVVGKARRAGTEGKVSLVQLEGDAARMRDVDREYAVDLTAGKIVSKEQLDGLQAVAAMPPAPERTRGNNPFRSHISYQRNTGEPA